LPSDCFPFLFLGAGGPAPEYLIEQSFTDAAVFLTVYPTTLDLTDEDYTTLGQQIKNYTDNYDRTVFLRFAPEMQGTWNAAYGFRPVAFKAMWATMYPSIKAIAPDVIIVWAPNLGTGYPYGQTMTDAAELAELDTNGDGAVTAADDPYGPYYPGDDQCDWIGISVYYKGPNYGANINQAQAPGYCTDIMTGVDPNNGAQSAYNFYETYCTKSGKACMFSESGASYHVDVQGGATQLAIQQAWWQDCITSDAFLDQFPRIKMLMAFEYEKYEDGNDGLPDLRDFRIANDTAVLAAFSSDMAAFATRVSWANYREPPADIPSSGIPADQPGGTGATTSVCTKYCGQVHFTTDRNPATGAPSLFGNTRESSAFRIQASIAVGISSLAMLFAGSWLTGRHARQASA